MRYFCSLSTFSVTLLSILSIVLPFDHFFPFLPSSALAQIVEDQKTEADRLLHQGIQQAQTSQFREAIQSWEAALITYREIGDKQGEGAALNGLGIAYRNLGQYDRAIDFLEQALVIMQEVGDRRGEGYVLGNLGNASLCDKIDETVDHSKITV